MSAFNSKHPLVISFLVSIILLILFRFHYSIFKQVLISTTLAWVLSCIVFICGIAFISRWPGKIFRSIIHRKNSHAGELKPGIILKSPGHFNIDPECLNVRIGNFQSSSPCISSVLSQIVSPSLKVVEDHIENDQDGTKNSTAIKRLLNGSGILQVNEDYYGCPERNLDFDVKKFKDGAKRSDIIMIELSLVRKNSIIRRSVMQSGLKSQNQFIQSWDYNSFQNSEEMMLFIDSLRKYSNGKPVGFNFPAPDQKNLNEICFAIQKTQVIPDFIVINALEPDPQILPGHTVTNRKTMYDFIQLVSSTLRFYKLEKHIKVIVKGKIRSAYDLLKFLALGANQIRSVEPVNGYEVEKNPAFKNLRQIHHNIMSATIKIMSLCGFRNTGEISMGSFLDKLDIIYSTSIQEQLLKNPGYHDQA